MMNRVTITETIATTADLSRALAPMRRAFWENTCMPSAVLAIEPGLPGREMLVLSELLRAREMFDAELYVAWTINGERAMPTPMGGRALVMLFAAMHAPNEDQRVSDVIVSLVMPECVPCQMAREGDDEL